MTRACSITKHTILQLKPNKVKFPPSGGGENPIVTALKKSVKLASIQRNNLKT